MNSDLSFSLLTAMHYDVKNSDGMLAIRLRTHDLWIETKVCYMLHTITVTAPHTHDHALDSKSMNSNVICFIVYIGANTNSNIAKFRDEQSLLILQKCPVCQISKAQNLLSNLFS